MQRKLGDRIRAAGLAIAAATLIGLAAPADARDEIPARPGRKLWGEIVVQGGSTDIPIHGIAGMKLSFKLKTWLGSELEPSITLEGPDDEAIDISGLVKTKTIRNKKKGDRFLVSFKKLLLAKSGTYRVIVHGEDGTNGGFDVTTKGSAPKRHKGEVELTQPGEVATFGFGAMPEDRVKIIVKGVGKPKWTPILRRLLHASGTAQPLGLAGKAGPLTLEGGGRATIEVGRDDLGLGTVKYVLKFSRPRAAKERVDVADLHATGRLTGRIQVPGAALPAAGGAKAKQARLEVPVPAEIRAGELIVGTLLPEPPDALIRRLEETVAGVTFQLERGMTESGPYLVRIPHLVGVPGDRRLERQTQTIVDAVARSGWVRYCEPNGVYHALGDPSDPRFGEQYGLRAIRAPEAWDLEADVKDVIVAVVDTGYRPHPDMSGQTISNGFDFVSDPSNSDDGDGWDAVAIDDSGPFIGVYHGLHVMGIVGAATDNGVGVAGTCPRALIQSVRVLGRFGGSWFDIAAGVRWASGLSVFGVNDNTRPARVINMSLGGPSGSETMRLAMVEVGALTEAVVVAAAGNSSSSAQHFPAAYPEVISVSAVGESLQPASYSNLGGWISVAAPGGDFATTAKGILSTHKDAFGDTSYDELEGTSMASPHVAGVAALMLAADPTLSASRVRTELEATAVDLGPVGFDERYGWGLVNAEAAVRAVVPSLPPAPPSLAVIPPLLDFGPSTGSLFIHVSTTSGPPIDIQRVTATADNGGTWITTSVSATETPALVTVVVDQEQLRDGVFTGEVEVVTDLGTTVVPLRVFRNDEAVVSSISIRVLAADNSVVAGTFTNADKDWEYEIDDLPLGRYRITASIDVDGDLVIDRADEWFTTWPVPSNPQWFLLERKTNDRDDLNMTLQRWGEQIRIEGVGGGAVDGAMAFKVVDAATDQPIAGAEVLVGDGVFRAATNNAGRAVIVAPVQGEQTVTASAAGYATRTHAGMNAQFHTLRLELAATRPPSTDVRVTALELDSAVDEVVFQAGNTRTVARHTGSGRVTATLSVPTSRGLVPVFALAHEPGGIPVRYGEGEAVVGDGGTVSVDLVTAQPPAQPNVFQRIVLLPASFDPRTTGLDAEIDLLWGTGDRLPLGLRPFPTDATQGDMSWLAYPGHPLLGQIDVGLSLRATDDLGRESVRLATTSTVNFVALGSPVQLMEAPVPIAPSEGSSVSRTGLLLEYDAVPGTQLSEVRILDSFDAPYWTLLIAGQDGEILLPSSAQGTLRANSIYTWSVESIRVPGLISNTFRHLEVERDATDRAKSETVQFRTR